MSAWKYSHWIGMAFVWMGLCVQCVEPIEINVLSVNSLLVVEGMITSQQGPYTVKLSRSSSLDSLGSNPVEGASVHIEERNGETVLLSERFPGMYETPENGFRGQLDQQYRLLIELSTGEQYESRWETLEQTPPIEQLYFRYETGITPRGRENGVTIFLDTEDPGGRTQYFRWNWDATWIHVVPFVGALEYLGNDEARPKPSNPICWNSDTSAQILIGTTAGNSQSVIREFPITFVSNFGTELRFRYSILIKQMALDEEEYLFWNRLKEANSGTGTLFDRQPQTTVGNVKRVNNEDEPVLGYFSASSIQELRLYINQDDLPMDARIGVDYLTDCLNVTDTLLKEFVSDAEVLASIDGGEIFYDFYRDPDILGYILTDDNCSDCTFQGGTTERPDFWID